MSAETADLTKVDSAVSGLSSSPPEDKGPVKGHRRASSSAAGVFNISDLGKPAVNIIVILDSCERCYESFDDGHDANDAIEKEGKELEIAKETQKLNW